MGEWTTVGADEVAVALEEEGADALEVTELGIELVIPEPEIILLGALDELEDTKEVGPDTVLDAAAEDGSAAAELDAEVEGSEVLVAGEVERRDQPE